MVTLRKTLKNQSTLNVLITFYKAHIISFSNIPVTDLLSMTLMRCVFPGVWSVGGIIVKSELSKSHFSTALYYLNKTNNFLKQ